MCGECFVSLLGVITVYCVWSLVFSYKMPLLWSVCGVCGLRGVSIVKGVCLVSTVYLCVVCAVCRVCVW